MLLDLDDEVLAALRSSGQSGRVWGVAEYRDDLVELTVQQSGSVTFSGSSVDGQAATDVLVFGDSGSLVPKSKTDMLAPYGQEVSLYRDVTVRDEVWTVPLGVFRIVGNSDAFESVRETESTVTYGSSWLALAQTGDRMYSDSGLTSVGGGLYAVDGLGSLGSGLYAVGASTVEYSYRDILSWEIRIELVDRLRMISRAKIIGEASYPVPGNTVWDELRRLVPFPVVESLPDVAVPEGLSYEDRPSAVKLLCDALGGVPSVTRSGAFTVRAKDRWADTTITPEFDIEGTISWSDGQSDDFYNFVWAHSDDGEYSAFAALTDDSNPLSVNRAGESSYEHSSPLYKSNAEAQAGANTILTRLLGTRSRQVTVECLPEAIALELGDVGWVRDPVQGRAVLGEVVGLELPLDPTGTVQVTLTVAEDA